MKSSPVPYRYTLGLRSLVISVFLIGWGATYFPSRAAEIRTEAFKFYDEGHYAKARPLFHELIKSNPKDSEILYKLGNIEAMDKNYDEAISYYDRAISINPKDARILYNLGNMYFYKSEYRPAIQYFEEARLVDPDDRSVYGNLSAAYYKEGEDDKAVAILDLALARFGEEKQLLEKKGTLCEKLLLPEKSIECYSKLHEMSPGNAGILINLAVAYGQKGDHEKAYTYATEAWTLEPENPKINYNIGLSLYKMDRFAESLEYTRRAIAYERDYALAILNLGVTYVNLLKFDLAKEQLTHLKGINRVDLSDKLERYITRFESQT